MQEKKPSPFWIVLTALTTIITGSLFIDRLTYPYNEQGRYFDEDSATVYTRQSLQVIGIFALLSLLLFILSLIRYRRGRNKPSSSAP